ncbi:MAG: DUF1801 domain-containing protein [Leptospiraceae bacterium]|nr:DUF1801 domain-containing protein [Leptospiraceae bacterium]
MDHIQLGFFAGSFLNDPKKLLRGNCKFVRNIKIENIETIDEKEISTLIRVAVKAPANK